MIPVQSKEQYMAVKERIKSAIYRSGYSLDGFCREHDLSVTTFFTYTSYPNAYTLMVVSDACGVTADWILRGTDDNSIPKVPYTQGEKTLCPVCREFEIDMNLPKSDRTFCGKCGTKFDWKYWDTV